MRIGREGVEEVAHLLPDQGVVGDLSDETVQLLLVRKLAVDQQIGNLQEGAVLGQLVDQAKPLGGSCSQRKRKPFGLRKVRCRHPENPSPS